MKIRTREQYSRRQHAKGFLKGNPEYLKALGKEFVVMANRAINERPAPPADRIPSETLRAMFGL